MAFNLSEFMSNNQDFARGYTFYARIFNSPISTEKAMYLVKSSALPTSTIEEVTTSWQGMTYKLGSTHTYDTFTITFNIDINDNLRKQFLSWSKNVHDVESNLHGAPGTGSSGYLGELRIQHIGHQNEATLLTYTLHGAWPSVIGEVALSYETKEFATFDVTFTYQYFTTE